MKALQRLTMIGLVLGAVSLESHGGPLRVDFSRTDEGGVQPLQAGWSGFGLPATGSGEEVTVNFPDGELAGPGGSVAVSLAGNSHTRDYTAATGIFAPLSNLLSDGPLLNLPGIMTLSFAGLLDGVYELKSWHHTTQFGPSERPPGTPFDIELTDASGTRVRVATGLMVSDNASAQLTTFTTRFTVSGENAVHIDFIRGPNAGAADHFALPGFELSLTGPPPPPLVLGMVLLNEFVASNSDGIRDGDGNPSDWIEIWNSTGAEVDLSGWFLTDDPDNPEKWPLPAMVLAPDGYLLVFASGQSTLDYVDTAGHYHCNFSIDKAAGGYLALSKPEGGGGVAIESEIASYPAQPDDVSFGFYGVSPPLGDGYFTVPTPGRKNGTAVSGFVADTQFSHHRGCYDAPFEVTVTTATPDAVVRYTLDGSAPTATHGTVVSGAIPVTTTTILRAAAFKDGFEASNVDTQTYLFVADVPNQPATPVGFPTTWTGWDYGMDQDLASLRAIVDNPAADESEARTLVASSLRSLPALSIVMDTANLFGASAGIYHNTQGSGMAWERQCSAELIDPVTGGLMQVDCGIRMQGFTSRDPLRNPKHSLRLVFRRQYGEGKLSHPLFGAGGAREFNTIVLRSNSQDAWVYDSAANRVGQFVRDEWNRQTQLAMGRPAARGMWVHLYLNGLYWGVYNPTERPDANFAASYLGGGSDDYDALKNHEEVVDGNGAAYAALLALVQNDPANFSSGYRDFSSNAAWQAIQGNNPDGTRNPALPDYLDVANLIDYVIHNMYSAATDWPGNFYMVRDRLTCSTGFNFVSWDNEHGMKPAVTENRTLAHSRDADSPTKFHHALRANAEYRMLFADHLHRAFFNDGPLTAANAAARWMEITGAIEPALIAESARWGDYRRANPYTVSGDFKPLRQSLLDNWFPQRSAIVLGQFRAQGLYPSVEAPAFSKHGGSVPVGHLLGITVPRGTVYFTLDGSDPRLPGGGPNPDAATLETGTVTQSLVTAGAGNWAYLASAVPQSDSGIVAGHAAFGTGDWKHPDFDENGWDSGAAPLGYGSVGAPAVATIVAYGPDAGNKFPTTYFRKHFSVSGATAFSTLTISLRRDDGAVVYLNGHEIARSNFPAGNVAYESLAPEVTGTDETATFTSSHTLTPGQLRDGMNVLATEVHQSAPTSSDLVFDIDLKGTRTGGGPGGAVLTASGPVKARALDGGQWSALNEATFIVGIPASPTNLVVSELLYKPSGGGALEFVEVMNISAARIELSNVRFTAGIGFNFPDTFSLSGGARALVVDNRAAFEAAFGPGLNIAGEFTGDLDNGGESITLTAADGSIIRSFVYDDALPWPPSPDTGGYSLTLVAPTTNPDHSNPANWRASVAPGGSPATGDAVTFTGDPGIDADADGFSALVEHALGSSDADPGSRGTLALTASQDGGFILTYLRNPAADDVAIVLETSADLKSWHTAPPLWAVIARESTTDGREKVSVAAPPAVPPVRLQFLRLRVSIR